MSCRIYEDGLLPATEPLSPESLVLELYPAESDFDSCHVVRSHSSWACIYELTNHFPGLGMDPVDAGVARCAKVARERPERVVGRFRHEIWLL